MSDTLGQKLHTPKVTHWHRISTAHLWLGSTVAACGELVFPRNLVESPTCPTCRNLKAELQTVDRRRAG